MAALALTDWHQRRGGEILRSGGAEVVWKYAGAASSGAGLPSVRPLAIVDRSGCDRLELVGEDRARFLNGQITCDVTRLEPGDQTYGYFTDGKGKVQADALVIALSDRLWIELPAGTASSLREHLEKYIVADRVDVRPLGDFVQLAVLMHGADASGRLGELLEGLPRPLGAPEPGSHWPSAASSVRYGSTELFAHWHPRLGVPALQVWVSSGIADAILDDLCASACEPAGFADLERARIVAGIPRFACDFDATNLPAEVAVDGAIDFDKGCYLGQEIVARLHYRGQAARQLRRYRALGEAALRAATALEAGRVEVRDDERDAGQVTSWWLDAAVPQPDGSEQARLSGLVMLRRSALEAQSLQLDGEMIEVVGPPAPLFQSGGSGES